MRLDASLIFEKDVRPILSALEEAGDGKPTGPLLLASCTFLANIIDSTPELQLHDLETYCREMVSGILERIADETTRTN